MQTDSIRKNLIPAAIVIAGLLIGGAIIYVNYQKGMGSQWVVSSQSIGEKVIKYINENILKGQMSAVLGGITKENGLYKVIIKINDQEIPSYVSPDGKLLFPEFINLEKELKEPTEEIQPESSEKELSEEKLEALAKCLSEKGAKFYGAYWCSWCNKQKELFGEAAQYLPYIECSEKETQQMTSQCQEAGITSFPTWVFESEKKPGFKNFKELAELSGCQL